MQVSTLLAMWHVKNLCYSSVFYSQQRVTLAAATVTCKITWYILKSLLLKRIYFCYYCIWNFIDILTSYYCKQNNTITL